MVQKGDANMNFFHLLAYGRRVNQRLRVQVGNVEHVLP